jgi:hypothetical protein
MRTASLLVALALALVAGCDKDSTDQAQPASAEPTPAADPELPIDEPTAEPDEPEDPAEGAGVDELQDELERREQAAREAKQALDPGRMEAEREKAREHLKRSNKTRHDRPSGSKSSKGSPAADPLGAVDDM